MSTQLSAYFTFGVGLTERNITQIPSHSNVSGEASNVVGFSSVFSAVVVIPIVT